ncbi:MAG: hypothetical protein KDC98_06470 [Planctomycetes bacterium]|nr:hypothetical protein [Planctomycetota bacterium]
MTKKKVSRGQSRIQGRRRRSAIARWRHVDRCGRTAPLLNRSTEREHLLRRCTREAPADEDEKPQAREVEDRDRHEGVDPCEQRCHGKCGEAEEGDADDEESDGPQHSREGQSPGRSTATAKPEGRAFGTSAWLVHGHIMGQICRRQVPPD